jgi:hypothetical protein
MSFDIDRQELRLHHAWMIEREALVAFDTSCIWILLTSAAA